MSNWINFRELRARLDFELVLRHYGVEVKRRGNQHQGFCPLPEHQGKKNSPSFSANLEKGIFQCFGCGTKGNILDFAALMERANLEDGTAFRQVALRLQERFCPPELLPANVKLMVHNAFVPPEPNQNLVRVINPALDFELKGLEGQHPYLKERGLTQETTSYFGLGFCARGLLKGRVVIPLHDQKGRLIGYAGRVVDDTTISEENPRYRLPSKRSRGAQVIEFRKSVFLYNGFRMGGNLDLLIIVESFTGVWWLHQNGKRQVVATMGADCSERQAGIIISLMKPSGRVLIMPDGDEAGDRFAGSLLRLLSPHRFVRWVKLREGTQPTDVPSAQLETLLVP